MTYAKVSGLQAVSDRLPGWPGVVVVPDRGGQRQDALQDPDHDSGGGVTAVAFEVELGFEGLVDRLDGLARGLEQVQRLTLAPSGSA
jgi:hypothetical protein